MKLLSFFAVSFFMFGCASSNIVRETIGDQEAVVKLGSGNIQPGDRVEIFKQSCREVYRRTSEGYKCTKNQIGLGSVVQLRANDEAIVKADNGVTLEQGLLVETISR